ncbi:transcriptional regulator [Bacillus sp. HMSC76G11]|nr:transcriptional regulator [Bacillus sp. HMSC76G11]
MLECKIGEIIDSKGLRKNFIAKKLGVTPQTLSGWIHNKHFIPIDKAFKIADLLGCKVDDLYKEEHHG